MERGRIVKALSGFYYVDSGNGTLTQCRARGRFRKERMSPLVGDWVRFSGSGAQGMVEEIEPRRNSFIRPAVSNLDALVVLASGANPVTDPFLIDRVAAIAGNQNVPVVLCVNKTDLESGESLTHIYRHAGFPVFPTSAASGEGVDALHEAVRGKTVVIHDRTMDLLWLNRELQATRPGAPRFEDCCTVIDSFVLARAVPSERRRNGLDALLEWYGLGARGGHHDAYGDAALLSRVFFELWWDLDEWLYGE